MSRPSEIGKNLLGLVDMVRLKECFRQAIAQARVGRIPLAGVFRQLARGIRPAAGKRKARRLGKIRIGVLELAVSAQEPFEFGFGPLEQIRPRLAGIHLGGLPLSTLKQTSYGREYKPAAGSSICANLDLDILFGHLQGGLCPGGGTSR